MSIEPDQAPKPKTTGQAIVDGLVAHGVDTVFGIPGVQSYELFEALANTPSINTIVTRHEQAAAYMALGYAQSSGKTGVLTVVPGPGLLNAAAGLLTGLGTSTPMLCVTSDVPTPFLGRGFGHLHEMADQLGTAAGFSKWSVGILTPADAPGAVAEGFFQAENGRPGPVILAAPHDVLTESAPVLEVAPKQRRTPPLNPVTLEAAAQLARGAKNPMIMVGSGARHAQAEVLALAEKLQAPVVSFRGGRGIVPHEHPLAFTAAEGFERWAQTDVLIGIGSRLELTWMRWPDRPAKLKLVNIDIDPHQQLRLEPDVAITADSAEATGALADLLAPAKTSRHDEFTAVRAAVTERIHQLQPHQDYLDAIRAAMPEDGYFVEELSQIGFASLYGFPVHGPRHFITAGHQGTLGFGFPTALGVKVAHPDKAVVSVTGDGGFMFAVQELATAVQYNIAAVTIVFDNGAYGNVKADQLRIYGQPKAVDLDNPDFVTLARAFGADAYTSTSPAELEETLATALAANRPSVIVVPMPLDAKQSAWPYLMPASRSQVA